MGRCPGVVVCFIYFYFLISHPQDPAVVSWWRFQKRSTETDREAGAGGRVSDKGVTSVRVSCGLIVCIQVVVYGEYLACECKTEVVLLLLMLAKHTDYLSHPDWVRSPRRNWKGPLLYLACCHHNPTSEGTWWCPYFSLLLFSEGTTDTFCSSMGWKGSWAKRYRLYLQFLSSPQSLIGARWLTGRLACCYHVLLQLSSHECFTIFAGRPDLLAQYSFVVFLFCF